GGPVLLVWLAGWDLAFVFDGPHSPWKWALLAYVVTCWSAALLVLPVSTVRRLIRKRPVALVSNHTRTVDVADQLGYLPIGRGFWRHLTRLPGNDVFRVDFTEKRLQLPRLPAAWNGLTILHLSDFHFNGTPDRKFFECVAEECRAWEPDLVAI